MLYEFSAAQAAQPHPQAGQRWPWRPRAQGANYWYNGRILTSPSPFAAPLLLIVKSQIYLLKVRRYLSNQRYLSNDKLPHSTLYKHTLVCARTRSSDVHPLHGTQDMAHAHATHGSARDSAWQLCTVCTLEVHVVEREARHNPSITFDDEALAV